MKTYLFPLVPAVAVTVLLGAPAIAAPALQEPTPIYTNTDQPNLAPVEGTAGQTDLEQPNQASPSGAVKNMAPVRGKPTKEELEKINPGDSASGLTLPGASSGSSFGPGSNSTLGPTTEPDASDLFSD
jgi:hypothetical protein